MLEQEINEFGRRLGLGGLSLSQAGAASLRISGTGRFSIEVKDDGKFRHVVLALSDEVPSSSVAAEARRLLAECDWRLSPAFPLAAGVHGSTALVRTMLSEKESTAANMENALRFLASVLHAS